MARQRQPAGAPRGGPTSPCPTRRLARAQLLVLALGLLVACNGEEQGRLRAFGTIEAREVRLASRVPGRVLSVEVEEGEAVEAGQLLVTLDLSELVAARDQAAAALAAAAAQEQLLVAGARREDVRVARQALQAAQLRQEEARRELERARKLDAGQAIARKSLDDARTALQLARTDVAARRTALARLLHGARPEELQAVAAARAQAAAALRASEERLEDRRLPSPIDGVVLARLTEPAEVIRPGQTLLTLGELSRPYLDVYVPEPRVAEAAPGTGVEVRVDALPGQLLTGTVQAVAGEAEFTPKNVQTADQRARLVFRVRIDVEDPSRLLHPGMPAEALFSRPAPPRPTGKRIGDAR